MQSGMLEQIARLTSNCVDVLGFVAIHEIVNGVLKCLGWQVRGAEIKGRSDHMKRTSCDALAAPEPVVDI